MQTLDVLTHCRLFSQFSQPQLQRILPLCAWKDVADGAMLFRQGQPARHLYVVAQGRATLDLTLQRSDGSPCSPPATVAVVCCGEPFGWSAVMEPHVMTLSARATGPSSFVLLDGPQLKGLLQHEPDLGHPFMTALAQLLSDRLMQTREVLLYERGLAVPA